MKKQPLTGEDVGWGTLPVKLPLAPPAKASPRVVADYSGASPNPKRPAWLQGPRALKWVELALPASSYKGLR